VESDDGVDQLDGHVYRTHGVDHRNGDRDERCGSDQVCVCGGYGCGSQLGANAISELASRDFGDRDAFNVIHDGWGHSELRGNGSGFDYGQECDVAGFHWQRHGCRSVYGACDGWIFRGDGDERCRSDQGGGGDDYGNCGSDESDCVGDVCDGFACDEFGGDGWQCELHGYRCRHDDQQGS